METHIYLFLYGWIMCRKLSSSWWQICQHAVSAVRIQDPKGNLLSSNLITAIESWSSTGMAVTARYPKEFEWNNPHSVKTPPATSAVCWYQSQTPPPAASVKVIHSCIKHSCIKCYVDSLITSGSDCEFEESFLLATAVMSTFLTFYWPFSWLLLSMRRSL